MSKVKGQKSKALLLGEGDDEGDEGDGSGDRREGCGPDAGGHGSGCYAAGAGGHVDDIVLLEVEIRAVEQFSRLKVDGVMTLYSILFADEEDTFAFSGQVEVACTSEGLKDGDFLGIHGVGAGVANLTENGNLVVLDGDVHDGILNILANLSLEIGNKLVARHTFDVDGTEDGEIDVALRIDKIGKRSLLGIGGRSISTGHLAEGEVVGGGDGFVCTTNHDGKAVIFLDDSFVLSCLSFRLDFLDVLEIEDVFLGGARGSNKGYDDKRKQRASERAREKHRRDCIIHKYKNFQ